MVGDHGLARSVGAAEALARAVSDNVRTVPPRPGSRLRLGGPRHDEDRETPSDPVVSGSST